MLMPMDLINLTLGVVGTTAGILALVVHFWRLKREKPDLVIRVLKCDHAYDRETQALSFLSEIEIRNIGDRGTDILGVDLKFDYKKTEYAMKTFNQDDEGKNGNVKWIRPHETIRTIQSSLTRFGTVPKKQIQCLFTVYETHGTKEVEATSNLN